VQGQNATTAPSTESPVQGQNATTATLTSIERQTGVIVGATAGGVALLTALLILLWYQKHRINHTKQSIRQSHSIVIAQEVSPIQPEAVGVLPRFKDQVNTVASTEQLRRVVEENPSFKEDQVIDTDEVVGAVRQRGRLSPTKTKQDPSLLPVAQCEKMYL